jgi:uncharacterized protein with PIN domain
MIVETSALVAIVFEEQETAAYTGSIAMEIEPRMSAASYLGNRNRCVPRSRN